MYDRGFGDKELSFEPSGALLRGSLVMRDRETDSWWSIIESTAIGGELQGSELTELPVSEKTTWGAWRSRHPDTLVLSIDGREHEPKDGYADYWTSDRTFRNLEVPDDRLPAKEPIFAFWIDDQPYAVAHRDFAGGRIFDLGDNGPRLYLSRPEDAPLRLSSRGFLVPTGIEFDEQDGPAALEKTGAEPLIGFDTFWYSWVAIHRDSVLLP